MRAGRAVMVGNWLRRAAVVTCAAVGLAACGDDGTTQPAATNATTAAPSSST